MIRKHGESAEPIPGRAVTRRRLTCNRSLVLDLVALCERNALFPIERTFELAELMALRARLPVRISWPVLFLKAYSRVAAVTPALRQAYVRWPRPHLCEFRENVGIVAVSRVFCGEDRLCWGRFIRPDEQSLVALQKSLDAYQHEPVEAIFKRQVQFSRLPMILRRIIWRVNMNLTLSKRPSRLGTFSISSVSGHGAVNRFHPTLTTSSLTFGPFDGSGRGVVTLIGDHRVFDGELGARTLIELERELRGSISAELQTLADASTAQRA